MGEIVLQIERTNIIRNNESILSERKEGELQNDDKKDIRKGEEWNLERMREVTWEHVISHTSTHTNTQTHTRLKCTAQHKGRENEGTS